jgi:hypothetical protein
LIAGGSPRYELTMLTTNLPTLHVEKKGIYLTPLTAVQASWFADRVFSVSNDLAYDFILREYLEKKGMHQSEIYATLMMNYGESDGSFKGEKTSYGYPFGLRRADEPNWKYVMVFRDFRGVFQFDFFKVENADIARKSSPDSEEGKRGKDRQESRERPLIRGIVNEPLSEFTQNDMNAVKDEFIRFLELGWGSLASKKEIPDFVCHVRSENLIYGKLGSCFSTYYPDEDAFSEALSAFRLVLSQSLI